MPLGLSFNQYGLYSCVSFWSPSLSRDLVISQLVGLMTCYVPIRISSLGKSLTISMKQRADRLLLRIYFAPYGRTNNAVVEMTLPEDNSQIFASKYETVLPKKEDLKKILEEQIAAEDGGEDNETSI